MTTPAPAPLKKRYFRLPPECSDGEHWTICESPFLAAEALHSALAESAPGESFTVHVVEMTDAEAEALPDV